MLVGNTDHEGGLLTGLGQATNQENIAKGGVKGFGAALMKASNDYIGSNPTVAMVKGMAYALGDSMFVCGSAQAAKARRDQKVPVWRYRWMATWNNTAITPNMGAYHSSEIPIVFGATQLKRGATPDTPEESKFIKNVMTAWATFAKDPDKGLERLGWPQYNPDTPTLVRLGNNNKSDPDFAPSAPYDSYCDILSFMSGGYPPTGVGALPKSGQPNQLGNLAGLLTNAMGALGGKDSSSSASNPLAALGSLYGGAKNGGASTGANGLGGLLSALGKGSAASQGGGLNGLGALGGLLGGLAPKGQSSPTPATIPPEFSGGFNPNAGEK